MINNGTLQIIVNNRKWGMNIDNGELLTMETDRQWGNCKQWGVTDNRGIANNGE